ncbi:MAG: alpha/beta hydrolase [Proteobacteria bacterium]|nr:alpha/beta hydrolase [Pseudomonadota bacterium]
MFWRRLALVIAALVFVSACAPQVAPAGTTSGPAALSDSVFNTSDGLQLPVRRWLPADNMPKAIVLALHGFNDYSKAFDKVPDAPGVGPTLAAAGIAVYAYDQRGFGKSPNAGIWAGREAMVGDFKDFVALLRKTYPGVPIYALGESMGGAVVIAGLADSVPGFVDGAILAAPAVWARSTMPFTYRMALWVGVRLMPGFKPSGRGLGYQASDNIEMLRDNGRDPLFIKETRIDSIYGLSNLMDEALARVGEIQARTLYLYGAKDEIIPKAPTQEALMAMAGANRRPQIAFYPNGWHILLRDKEAPLVLNDIISFITRPNTPLPSHADDEATMRLQKALNP